MVQTKQYHRHSLCNVTSHVQLFAYPIKLDISTRKRASTKILPKNLYCDSGDLCNAIKRILDKIPCNRHFKLACSCRRFKCLLSCLFRSIPFSIFFCLKNFSTERNVYTHIYDDEVKSLKKTEKGEEIAYLNTIVSIWCTKRSQANQT